MVKSTGFEERLKFTAAVISGLITWLATLLFLREYLGLVTIILVTAVAIMRLNAIALCGGFLVSLAIELNLKGASGQFYVVILLLFVSILVELGLVFWPAITRGIGLSISISENVFLAVVGMAVAYGLQFAVCRDTYQSSLQSIDLVQIWSSSWHCSVSYAQEAILGVESNNLLTAVNAGVLFIGRLLLLSPLIWAILLASLRQARFNISKLDKLVVYFFIGLLGYFFSIWFSQATTFIAALISVVALQQETPSRELFLLVIGGDIFFSCLGIGWAISRAKD